jgi:hypothetical protein
MAEANNSIDLSEYLQKTIAIIGRSELPQEDRQFLDDLVAKIEKRVKDPNCYLAVIGEFSSGKSTLVNAFLREDLLPTSALVTTASATRLYHGSSLGLTAYFHHEYQLSLLKPTTNGNDRRSHPRQHRNWLCRLLQKLVGFFGIRPNTVSQRNSDKFISKRTIDDRDLAKAGIDIRSFITKLAAEEDVAKDLDYMEISHPSNFLQDGVVIIDLPGVNAPNERHLALTRSVVELEANAAIIIIPALQPLTKSLMDFLEATVSSYMERCVFIVTRMDQIREKDRQKVIDSVKAKLQDSFSVKNSSVYACSAQLALDKHLDPSSADIDGGWLAEFQAMEKKLIKRLQMEREKAIRGSISRLFDRLFEELEDNLNNRWQVYQDKKTALEAELVKDFAAFTNQMRPIYRRQILESVSRTKERTPLWLSSQTSYMRDRVKGAIFQTNSWDNLKLALASQIETILNEGKTAIGNEIQQHCNEIKTAVSSASQDFDRSFSNAYQNLSTLSGSAIINSFSNLGAVQINTTAVLASARQLNEQNFGNAMKGLFSHLFKGMLEERQRLVWSRIQPNLDVQFQEIEKIVIRAIDEYGNLATRSVDDRLSYYLSVYLDTVNRIMAEQQQELATIEQFQRQTQNDLREIGKMQNSINSS